MKTYVFTLTVKTNSTKRWARDAVLVAFAKRMPDDCEFYLKESRKKKSAK